MKNTKIEKIIRDKLLRWSIENPRELPWKINKDPYRIWVSEIILQQTRVDQGLPYFERFVQKYPTIFDLAATNEDDLMKAWEGLGYYRRARYMHHTAKKIVEEYGGSFPKQYHQIIGLKGVGSYTAAAIASFAFDLPYVVVDGNVIRVISRLYAITDPVDQKHTKQRIEELATTLLDHNQPASFNQAIMDFGALQCRPVKPVCNICPISAYCGAFLKNQVQGIPAKKGKRPKKERFLYYVVAIKDDKTYIKRREDGDIWDKLYEFYLIESDHQAGWENILLQIDLPLERSITTPKKFKQTLSHQVIYAEFLIASLKDETAIVSRDNYMAIKTKKIRNFAFPKVIDCFLKDKDVILNWEKFN